MRFSLFICAALAAVSVQAVDLEGQELITKSTGYDPTKYNWIEKPPGSGFWVRKNKPTEEPKPTSHVQEMIRKFNAMVDANDAAAAETQAQMDHLAANKAAFKAK